MNYDCKNILLVNIRFFNYNPRQFIEIHNPPRGSRRNFIISPLFNLRHSKIISISRKPDHSHHCPFTVIILTPPHISLPSISNPLFLHNLFRSQFLKFPDFFVDFHTRQVILLLYIISLQLLFVRLTVFMVVLIRTCRTTCSCIVCLSTR